MSLVISSVFTYDEDAGNYIQAVETADGQALESATRKAINNFVIGCKQDGIWDAIKASCILSGARTLAGALVPLAGAAPTNYNFVSGDYNRKTGLVGDGSSKYLNSNRNNNADPQDSKHHSIYVSSTFGGGQVLNGAGIGGISGQSGLGINNVGQYYFRVNNALTSVLVDQVTGFLGASRSSSSTVGRRISGSTAFESQPSETPLDESIGILGRITGSNYSNARLAFYSIGESLDLAKLDGRVTDLINKFAQVIP